VHRALCTPRGRTPPSAVDTPDPLTYGFTAREYGTLPVWRTLWLVVVPTLQELVVTPPKVAGLTIVSRELADDSTRPPLRLSVTGWPVTSPAASTRLRSRGSHHQHQPG